ncbi:ABC transporter ATP-binding protein [Christensenellaceae bacterium OttesenSCG-928-M15]|nr:ABC transporter ATP-binding protein [Christensenellaceae bacterium OttesenSCG-928-M15]
MQENILEIKDLSIEYIADRDIVKAVNNVCLSLKKGETLGIVGETGAGKTTTALGVMRLLPDKAGRVTNGAILFEGQNIFEFSEAQMRAIRGSKIAMIFQDPMTALNPVLTVGDQIAEMLELHASPDTQKKDISDKVDALLEMVGIPCMRKAEYPHQFSGGMKQRVVIAIALACNPALLIADEPTTALDVTIQAQVLEMISNLKKELGTSMVLITHDFGVVASTCDQVAVMYAGEIVEAGPLETIFQSPSHPYTIGLFQSIPDMETKRKRLLPIDGLMPDPTNLPGGCKFHPRCPKCIAVCKTEAAPLCKTGGHFVQCHLFNNLEARE